MQRAQDKMHEAEILVNDAQNDKKLTSKQVDLLLHSYVSGLQSTIVMQNSRISLYSSELQQFVQNCCSGIEQSAKLREKLLHEQVEHFEKAKKEFF